MSDATLDRVRDLLQSNQSFRERTQARREAFQEQAMKLIARTPYQLQVGKSGQLKLNLSPSNQEDLFDI